MRVRIPSPRPHAVDLSRPHGKRGCDAHARNDLFQSLVEALIVNVGRDRDKGARFARIPTGFETCTFCLMFASRGTVYHSRKAAGE